MRRPEANGEKSPVSTSITDGRRAFTGKQRLGEVLQAPGGGEIAGWRTWSPGSRPNSRMTRPAALISIRFVAALPRRPVHRASYSDPDLADLNSGICRSGSGVFDPDKVKSETGPHIARLYGEKPPPSDIGAGTGPTSGVIPASAGAFAATNGRNPPTTAGLASGHRHEGAALFEFAQRALEVVSSSRDHAFSRRDDLVERHRHPRGR